MAGINQKYHETLNSISHGIGAILAFVGFYFLLIKNDHKSSYAILSIVIYSATLISMFLISALYHAAKSVKLRNRLRKLDHINIFYLIAGTYTPLTLITLINGNGLAIFYTVWGIALVGTVLKIFFTGKYELVSLILYLAMGWLIVFDFRNLMDLISPTGTLFLFLGGAFYTLGIVFYTWERIPYSHFIWHLFVLGGALSHWLFIFFDVV